MIQFLKKLVIFFIPLVLGLLYVEIDNRNNNTFQAKKTIIDKYSESIELLILGSSQSWRGINPEYLETEVAPLAHGGGAFNVDYLVFKKFVDDFPRLKLLLLEVSYHSLETYRDKNWNKNHLFNIYYDINNYDGKVPLRDNMLITANFNNYIKKVWKSSLLPEFGEFNKYGFITSSTKKLDEGKYEEGILKHRHQEKSIENFKKNTQLLDEIISECKKRGVSVVLFSPPKYVTYNQLNNCDILKRRDSVLHHYEKSKDVYIWNYDKLYENNRDIFSNEDHLNVYGAKKLTLSLNKKIKKLSVLLNN